MRSRLAALVSLAFAVGAGGAAAGTVADACTRLEDSGAAGCRISKAPGQAWWTLTTRFVAGSGSKWQIEALEQQFCDEVRERGIGGHVTRWSRLSLRGGGARMEWSCGPPAVSAGPR